MAGGEGKKEGTPPAAPAGRDAGGRGRMWGEPCRTHVGPRSCRWRPHRRSSKSSLNQATGNQAAIPNYYVRGRSTSSTVQMFPGRSLLAPTLPVLRWIRWLLPGTGLELLAVPVPPLNFGKFTGGCSFAFRVNGGLELRAREGNEGEWERGRTEPAQLQLPRNDVLWGSLRGSSACDRRSPS